MIADCSKKSVCALLLDFIFKNYLLSVVAEFSSAPEIAS